MKKPVNMRIDEDLLAEFDQWIDEQGWSRTRAIERFMRAAVGKGPSPIKPADSR